MDKKELMMSFFKKIKYRKLWTKFLINIFDYQNFSDFNYIYRFKDTDSDIILDVYDNISSNRFNRYIFSFRSLKKSYQIDEYNNVFVTVIDVLNSDSKSDNNLIKLAYLFSLDKQNMNEYAKTFLSSEFVKIITEIIK